MNLKEIIDLVNGKVYCVSDESNIDIRSAGASDLMSDVLAFLSKMPSEISHEMLLITGLVSLQSIRTASITDISVILFSRGKEPSANIIEAAENAGISIICTPLTSYTVCGVLYAAGIKGVDDNIPE